MKQLSNKHKTIVGLLGFLLVAAGIITVWEKTLEAKVVEASEFIEKMRAPAVELTTEQIFVQELEKTKLEIAEEEAETIDLYIEKKARQRIIAEQEAGLEELRGVELDLQ